MSEFSSPKSLSLSSFKQFKEQNQFKKTESNLEDNDNLDQVISSILDQQQLKIQNEDDELKKKNEELAELYYEKYRQSLQQISKLVQENCILQEELQQSQMGQSYISKKSHRKTQSSIIQIQQSEDELQQIQKLNIIDDKFETEDYETYNNENNNNLKFNQNITNISQKIPLNLNFLTEGENEDGYESDQIQNMNLTKNFKKNKNKNNIKNSKNQINTKYADQNQQISENFQNNEQNQNDQQQNNLNNMDYEQAAIQEFNRLSQQSKINNTNNNTSNIQNENNDLTTQISQNNQNISQQALDNILSQNLKQEQNQEKQKPRDNNCCLIF